MKQLVSSSKEWIKLFEEKTNNLMIIELNSVNYKQH